MTETATKKKKKRAPARKKTAKDSPADHMQSDATELAAGLRVLDALLSLRHDELKASAVLADAGAEQIPRRDLWLNGGTFSELCEVVPLTDLDLTLLLAITAPWIDDRVGPRLGALTAGTAAAPTGAAGPTIEALRNLAGRTIIGRQHAVRALDSRALLHQARLVRTETSDQGPLAHRIVPTDAALELLLGIVPPAPELRPDFPATPLQTSHELDDLVLAPAVRRRLDDVLARVRNENTVLHDWQIGPHHDNAGGFTMLLHGPPGTGKTMTAAILAKELGLPALRVDLSSLVSKYIGETSKNLERVFSHAEQRQCLLFFDEADSVFGRRSEVNDARDRYANQEVSYLLQRLEQFPGVVVLATNLLANIDQAFIRRLDVMIELSAPDRRQRLDLWTRVFPDAVPQDDLDFAHLADQYHLTGAQIKDAAIDAAYHAAANGGVVTAEHLLRAVKHQFAKSGLMAPS